jgi:FkbM family methyltransferase
MPIFYSDTFRAVVRQDPLVYVDAGARGGLEGPWAEINDDRLYVVAFEPDPESSAELARRQNPREAIVPKALWSKSGTVPVHLAVNPATSSIHPPNWTLLARYPEAHGKPRTTMKTLTVESTTLDQALAALGCQADFIKIDTQGSEHEILAGATGALADSVFAVIAETWTVEVHKGQHLTGDILSFMHERGFELFDLSIAAAWYRVGSERLERLEKRQITGLDLMFFREPTACPHHFTKPAAAAKAAAIAELYGFPDLALEILDLCVGGEPTEMRLIEDLRKLIIDAHKAADQGQEAKPSFLQRVWRRQQSGRKPVKLHY